MNENPQIDFLLPADDGRTPNHPTLPPVVMRGTAAAESDDPAKWFEQQFQAHGWSGTWRWTVYPYQHFHSSNHEVLGVSRGDATLLLGGEAGEKVHVKVGDLIVIPAGVGHMRIASSDDFQVVGAYPGGREPDLLRPGCDLTAVRLRILQVPFPKEDPVAGALEPWRNR